MIHFARQQKFKVITLMDPSTGMESKSPYLNVEVINTDPGTFLYIGCINLLKGVNKKTRDKDHRGNPLPKRESYYEVDAVTCFEYPTLQFDWENDVIVHEHDSFMKDASPTLKPILRHLEEWFSQGVLKNTLSSLPSPSRSDLHSGHTESYASWVPFLMTQVVKQQLMELSNLMFVWDGTECNYKVRNPFVEKYSAIHTQHGYTTIERKDDLLKEYCGHLFVGINVWRNHMSLCPHWNICNEYRCDDEGKGSRDFLLFSNVEVRTTHPRDMSDEERKEKEGNGCNPVVSARMVDLNLRSGNHKGKGVRIVKENSILGRMFADRIKEVKESLIFGTQDTMMLSQTGEKDKGKEPTDDDEDDDEYLSAESQPSSPIPDRQLTPNSKRRKEREDEGENHSPTPRRRMSPRKKVSPNKSSPSKSPSSSSSSSSSSPIQTRSRSRNESGK